MHGNSILCEISLEFDCHASEEENYYCWDKNSQRSYTSNGEFFPVPRSVKTSCRRSSGINLVKMWDPRELSLGTALLSWDLLGVMKPVRLPARLALFVR